MCLRNIYIKRNFCHCRIQYTSLQGKQKRTFFFHIVFHIHQPHLFIFGGSQKTLVKKLKYKKNRNTKLYIFETNLIWKLKKHFDNSKLYFQYLTKQTAALREVNDSRLRIYEQLEISITELEKNNIRLNEESISDKSRIKR